MIREIEKEIFRQQMYNGFLADSYRYWDIFRRTKNKRIRKKNEKKLKEMFILMSIWSN